MNNLQEKIRQLEEEINYGKTLNPAQTNLIKEISEYGVPAAYSLYNLLDKHLQLNAAQPIDGLIYETLLNSEINEIMQLLKEKFEYGIVNLQSNKNIDYSKLQKLLVQKDFISADKLTQQKLCELAGIDTKKRKWLYFSEISSLPTKDLKTIDSLWRIHSLNYFGFSIQRQIWLSVKRDWDKFLEQIQWSKNNNLCRYPQDFIWDLSAPKGHLPLFNQLRGAQTLISLLSHEAWN